MPSMKELLSMLQDLEADPELRDFIPLFEEMKEGVDPNYHNVPEVLDLFVITLLAFRCKKIAEKACINANNRKNWYEPDD